MQATKESVRRRTRIPLTLPIRVICRESAEYQWTEQSRLVDVTHFGAGFTLSRPIEAGRLIQLIIPMPRQLRCFDYTEALYSVWSLVRHASSLTTTQNGSLFRVGVAFIGKAPPPSFAENPTLRYEPLPAVTGQQLAKLGRRALLTQRREARLVIPLEVLVDTIDQNGGPSMQEYTVTERISSLGACIPTSLDVGIGRILRVTSLQENFSLFAAIRSKQVAADGITRLGLEFIEGRWPLQRESRYTYRVGERSSGLQTLP